MTEWWERDDLRYDDGRLRLAGQDVMALARSATTPVYIYSAPRIKANLLRLRTALDRSIGSYRILYAMKSNRFAPILTYLKTLGGCGIDACSPTEIALARQCGFREDEISFTATALSPSDWDSIGGYPSIWLNVDSLSAIRRAAAVCPGREIGLRINPAGGVGYSGNALLQYSGSATTKFGIYRDRFEEALSLSASLGLRVAGLHFHVGCGYLNPQIEAWGETLAECRWFMERAKGIRCVNVGGGLGIPLVPTDEPLDLDLWASTLARGLGDFGVEIWVEPGDYLVKDSGLLVVEATMVEKKQETLFVGVDAGFNIHVEPAFYNLPLYPIACRNKPEREIVRLTISGNINEALDMFAVDVDMPMPDEGDLLALLNAGGYGSSMSSNHCLRGRFSEYVIF